MKYRLPKAERISGKRITDSLFARGNRFNENPFRVVWLFSPREKGAPFRFGISVPKKLVPKAHDRNRIRRQIREALRLSANELRQNLLASELQLDFFILYLGDVRPANHEISHKIILILNRLISLHETHPRHDSHRPGDGI